MYKESMSGTKRDLAKIRIYSITRKQFERPKETIYVPLVAGAVDYRDDEFPEGYLLDNTGDNISSENFNYSEYTALYWIWKNTDADIIGESHYRRFFVMGGWFSYLRAMFSKGTRYVLNEEQIKKVFAEGYNCILPKKRLHLRYNIIEHYQLTFKNDDVFDAVRDIIDKYIPEYSESFKNTMAKTRSYQKCIFVMSRNMFEDYMNWVFFIFDKLLETGREWRFRHFAHIGEQIFNVWIDHNIENGNLKVKECFYYNTEFNYFTKPFYREELYLPNWIEYLNFYRHKLMEAFK